MSDDDVHEPRHAPAGSRAARGTATCAPVRESLSASMDGEVALLPAAEVHAHLDGCVACARHAEGLAALQRATATAATPAPERTEAILAALGERTAGAPPRRLPELRMLVGLAGGVQLLLALPLLLGLAGPDAHAGRDLGALQLALGVGFVVAALQPRRASGVLPMGVALAGAVLVVATVDVLAGRVSAIAELTHLGELVGVAGLWVMARRVPAAPRPSPTVLPA